MFYMQSSNYRKALLQNRIEFNLRGLSPCPNKGEHYREKPGTYEVVFVGTNSDYLSATSEIKTITLNIIDKF